MTLRHFVKYAIRDICTRRTLSGVVIGAAAVSFASVSLLLTFAFSSSVEGFIEDCYHRARPVIGTLRLTNATGELITVEQEQQLLEYRKENPGVIDEVSWISAVYKLPIFKNLLEEVDGVSPKIWSLDDAAPFLSTKFGIEYISGGGFPPIEEGEDLQFGVLVNTRYLEDYLNFKENQIIELERGKGGGAVPEQIYIVFPSIPAEPTFHQPKPIGIPIVGFFSLRDEIFPHLIFNQDVGAAYFYQGSEQWKPTYTLQFSKFGTSEPLLSLPSGVQVKKDEIVLLPARDRLLDYSQMRGKGSTPYGAAFVHVVDFKKDGVREKIKAELDADRTIKSFPIEDGLAETLDARRPARIREILSSECDIELPRRNHEIEILVDNPGQKWRIKNRKTNQSLVQLTVDDNARQLKVARASNWHVTIPSSTVSQALNRVQSIVKSYKTAIICIVFILCLLSTFLFGMGHFHRKRKDMGLLKACGMRDWAIGGLFIAEVVAVALCGFVCGWMLAWILAIPLEPLAANTAQTLNPDYALDRRVLVVTASATAQTVLCVLGAALLGGLIPACMAMRVNPIEDLNTGV